MKITENVKKLMHLGIGAAALTEDKVESLVHDLIKKGELSEEEGKKTISELREKIKARRNELQEKIENTVSATVKKMRFVTREEFENLEKRIAALEKNRNEEKPADTSGTNATS